MIALPAEDEFVALFREVAQAADRKHRALDGLAPTSELGTLGLDSFTLMEILGRLEERLGVSLSDERIAGLRTIADVRAAFALEAASAEQR
ncbi:MAG: acyl carrier protein [Deltaproteobacteria bacterium]|nr:MAG: acyl carrier protein [Deltaproteobacteria bacterium]